MARPDPLESAQPDRLADDERIFDLQGNGSHIHGLDRCEHYVAGEEVGWLCGMLPMFTNIATANAAPGDIDDGEVVSCEPAEAGWDVVLRAREGGRLVIGHAANAVEAQYLRDTAAAFFGSWTPARIADLHAGDEDEIEEYARFDLSDCPYYRSNGKLPGCRDCHDEPACFTERPAQGWPSEQATQAEASAIPEEAP